MATIKLDRPRLSQQSVVQIRAEKCANFTAAHRARNTVASSTSSSNSLNYTLKRFGGRANRARGIVAMARKTEAEGRQEDFYKSSQESLENFEKLATNELENERPQSDGSSKAPRADADRTERVIRQTKPTKPNPQSNNLRMTPLRPAREVATLVNHAAMDLSERIYLAYVSMLDMSEEEQWADSASMQDPMDASLRLGIFASGICAGMIVVDQVLAVKELLFG